MPPDPQLPQPILLAIPAFAIMIVAEIFWAQKNAKVGYEPKDTAASLLMGMGYLTSGAASAGVIYLALSWAYSHRIFDFGYALWAYPLFFLIEDFLYYWMHRLSHEHRIWWAAHVIHHSSQHYNYSTAIRQTWTGVVAGTFIMSMPLAFLGFPPPLIVFQKGLSLVYQFWLHTEAIGRMPRWFEAVFNTPSHHRVHHATNPRYLDSNHGGMLIIWDKMFGTFTPEDDAERPRYGIVRNIGTFNPLRIAFHEWVGIFRDIKKARSPRDAFMYVFGPPGWSPDGSRRTTASIRAAWRAGGQAERNSVPATAEKSAMGVSPATVLVPSETSGVAPTGM